MSQCTAGLRQSCEGHEGHVRAQPSRGAGRFRAGSATNPSAVGDAGVESAARCRHTVFVELTCSPRTRLETRRCPYCHDLLAEDLLRQVMDHPLVHPEETTTAKALHGGGYMLSMANGICVVLVQSDVTLHNQMYSTVIK